MPFAAAFSPSFIPTSGSLIHNRVQTITASNHVVQVHRAVDVCTGPSSTQLYNLPPKEDAEGDDILDEGGNNAVKDGFDREHFDPVMTAQIEKAKQLLNAAKKKQEDAETGAGEAAAAAEDAAAVPFFATTSRAAAGEKIKATLASGDIVADGETMASLSAAEPWENRSLSQMFDSESRIDYDGESVEERTNTMADRDVGASIYGLRRSLRTEDFMKVFDKRNYFIGDLD